MLAESETLFVEHKGNLDRDQNFAFAKAVASFANTLGGWILLGVTNGEPNEGTNPGWTAPESHSLIDHVRQALDAQVDPLPSFSAAIRMIRGRRVGVVRIYESVDTPHILKNGSIVVREPAEDKNLRARGRAAAKPIATHYELTQLAARGERARARAEQRFADKAIPFIDSAMGLKYTMAASADSVYTTVHVDDAAIVVRATPLAMTRTFEDWASSLGAEEACRRAALDVVNNGAPKAPSVAARSVSVSADRGEVEPLTESGMTRMRIRATAAADAAGVVAVRAVYATRNDPAFDDHWEFDREGFVNRFLEPPMAAGVWMLQNAELFGRYLWHVYVLQFGKIATVQQPDSLARRFPTPTVALGAEMTIPAFGEAERGRREAFPEFQAVLTRWGYETSRAGGIPSWAD